MCFSGDATPPRDRARHCRRVSLVTLLTVACLLPGCAAFRSYDKELNQTLSMTAAGDVNGAIKRLQNDNKGKDKDLLFYLEYGDLLRLKSAFGDSQASWMTANTTVQAWEDGAKADPSATAGVALSYIINDKMRPYEGHDYEKVMLTTRMAMNDLAMANWENARVAIKQTHEREAVIADVRAKQYQQIEKEARKRGSTLGFQDLKGYPVETINDPEVNGLRNSYQSAFSHYLAGFIYEALGEPSLAAPGYRQAIELQPNIPLLEQGLAGLDQRVGARDDGLTDVLFEIETGLAPALVSKQFPIPVPINGTLIFIPISFPVIKSEGEGFVPTELRVGDTTLTPVQITSVDAMARRALKDDMNGIMLRGFIRATAKAVAQYSLQHQAQQQNSLILSIAALAVSVGSVVTESADERTWRTLPARISIARGKLPPGTHTVTLATPAGPRSVQVNISGRYTFISLRMIRGQFFPMLPVAGLGGGTPQAQPGGGTPQAQPVGGTPQAQLGGGAPQAQESAPASTAPIVESQSNLEESVK